ncbi:SDR family oxidoreductase [Inhella proteolytica]|uniref:SDR family oxidoreductase n=1 Tax=Inhella proteolytica TaxID=2795029 RepID=A0A931J712_9BURK|nr:SDR family oxidoreductase [Inhella proteolytica]MBH9579430.1 SDR family oxidoreductase [Inhella proteolytica]
MATILVVGASGTVGSELSRLLAAAGHKVRKATSRSPSAADQVHLNLQTGAGRDTAFAGVDRAFFLAPPGHTRQDLLLNPLVDAARAQGVQKVVLMTAMGANAGAADEPTPLRLAELHLEASGLAFNVIRPNWFMQNFNSFWLHGIQTQGQILLPTGEAKGSFIDARDIAAVAATLLVDERFNGQDFDLTGPEALDHHQVAAVLSQATGKAIGYTDIPPEAMREGLLAAGLPADYAEFMLVILGFFKAGYSARITDAVRAITGRAPRTLAQYAADYRAAWV